MAELKLKADSGGGTSSLKGPASSGATPSWRLPSADGSSGQFLKTDGSGVMSWSDVTEQDASTGDYTLTSGNLVIATSGKGIDFSASSSTDGSPTTEVLDDYEVGDWTPAVQFNYSGSETVTATGRYTKVGKMVFVSFRIAIDSNSGGGACKVTGLPYAKENPSGDCNSAAACFVENAISTPDGTPMMIFFDGLDYFEIRIAGETGAGNDAADYMDADTNLLGEYWYITA